MTAITRNNPVELDALGIPVASHVPRDLIRRIDLYKGEGMDGDPFVVVERLQQEPEIIYNLQNPRFGQSWLLTRGKDIRYVLSKPELFGSDYQAGFSKLIGETWRLACVEMDAPEHTKFRLLMNPWFSPKAVAKLAEKIRLRAEKLVDGISADGGCEFMSAFGARFPISIFMDLMGTDQDRVPEFLRWEHDILHSPNPETMTRGVLAMRNYLKEVIRDRRRRPRDDIATYAVQASFDGRPLTDDEVMSIYFVLFTGGLDTVAQQLGFHFRHMAMNPGHQQQLRDDPSKIPQAIEEHLRCFSTIQTHRQAKVDVELCGVAIRKGDWITLQYALGSRDPDEYEDPHAAKFDRKSIRHLGFGTGPHLCIGSHLARRELRSAVEVWLRRIPPFRVRPGSPFDTSGGIVFSIGRLELVWG